MKIRVKAEGIRLRLWFPLSVLKSRLGYTIVQRALTREVNKRGATKPEQQQQANSPITRKQVVEMYNSLRQCVKENGHFNLVEVNTHDGEKVTIRV